MTLSWLRISGALVALAGLAALALRRRGLLGRGEALAALVLVLLLALAVAPGLADALPLLTGFTGELARVTSLLAFAVLALTAALLALAGRLHRLRSELDEMTCEAVVDRAWPLRPASMQGPVDLVLVMPAYDEADNLRAILPVRPAVILGLTAHLMVIDDGSRDGTAEVAAAHGAWAIRSPHNRGGGFALKLGFLAARRLGARFVVTLDADGQHRFEDLPVVLAPLLAGTAELVIGSRRLGAAIDATLVRALGVRVFSALLTFLTRQQISDCSSGLRGLQLERIGELRLHQARHHTAELIIEAARRRLTITEVPITIVPRHTGHSKKGGSLGYALRFAGTIVTSWWRR